MALIAVWVGKCVALLLRSLGRSATSLPGLVALRIAPRLLEHFGSQVKFGAIVTGTNGKTTTTNILHRMLEAREPNGWIVNNAGSNMLQGIATTFVQSATFTGRLSRPRFLLEVDEANVPLITKRLPVNVAVVTNVFRDQLDRYGEVDTTMDMLCRGLSDTRIELILNADEPLSHAIGLSRGDERVVYFGMERHPAASSREDSARDGAFCLQCGAKLHYQFFQYGQVGSYACPSCTFGRPDPHLVALPDEEVLHIQTPQVQFDIPTSLPGLYNLYNLLAATAAAVRVGCSPTAIREGAATLEPAPGRMQRFAAVPDRIVNLVKNPTGFNAVLQTMATSAEQKTICLVINDQDADGRDVSWLWDVDFELYTPLLRAVRWVCTGSRGWDMAVRLKYAGVPTGDVWVKESMEEAHAAAVTSPETVWFCATYTALFDLIRTVERGLHDAPAPRTSVSGAS